MKITHLKEPGRVFTVVYEIEENVLTYAACVFRPDDEKQVFDKHVRRANTSTAIARFQIRPVRIQIDTDMDWDTTRTTLRRSIRHNGCTGVRNNY